MCKKYRKNKMNQIAKLALYGTDKDSLPMIQLRIIDNSKLLENILHETGLTEDELAGIVDKMLEEK